jgi:uncharacterized protein
MFYALFYETAPDYLARRAEYRPEHLTMAGRYRDEGKLLLAGAFDPPEGALLIFRTESRDEVEDFARQDVYVRNGLVTKWYVREWKVVIESTSRPSN